MMAQQIAAIKLLTISKKYKKIKIIRHTKNFGKGYSIRTGMKTAQAI